MRKWYLKLCLLITEFSISNCIDELTRLESRELRLLDKLKRYEV